MDRSELIEIRSEEIEDIISRNPSWLLRWGTILMFFVFIVLIGISWFIRYPDVIKGTVVVTTDPSPIFVVSRAPGKITLLKKENDLLNKDDLIGYIQSNADPLVVLYLERLIDDFYTDHNFRKLHENIKEPVAAGSLQSQLNITINTVKNFLVHNENQLLKKQILHLENQKSSYEKLKTNLQAQFKLVGQETKLKTQLFQTDSLLFSQGVISTIAFNQSKMDYIQQQRNQKNLESSIISNELQIELLEKQIMELKIEEAKQQDEFQENAMHTISELSAQITLYKQTYLFIAPTSGKLAILGFIENNQHVEPRELFAVLPATDSLMAKAELPLVGAGKVKIGQSVRIQLNNYPQEQFGILRGVIESISPVPNRENYALLIRLPQGMRSSYNRELEFQPQLHGQMEIITEDLRLLERFFNQFRVILNNS